MFHILVVSLAFTFPNYAIDGNETNLAGSDYELMRLVWNISGVILFSSSENDNSLDKW